MNVRRPFLRPRALRKGDSIALLTLASPSRDEDLQAGADQLRALGFEPVIVPAVSAASVGYVAGDGLQRAAQLHAALAAPGVGAIIATRGGYGSAHMLPHLDLAAIRDARRILVGYSDITAVLDVCTGHAGLVSIHGPMVEGRLARGESAYDRDGFLRTVCEPVAFGRVHAPEAVALRGGRARGVLRGGTLTQLAALLGTPWAFRSAEPTILFLDDVNERPYRLDRLLWQITQAGVLQHVTGIVLNQLPGCEEPGGTVTALEAVRHALADFAGPIAIGVPSGHTPGAMVTLPFGVHATLDASDEVVLTIDEPAVE